MTVHHISVAEYQHIAHDDGFDCTETIMLAGTWPISVGKHPDYPGRPILIGHVQDRAFLVTLDPVPDPDPASVERALTINSKALQ